VDKGEGKRADYSEYLKYAIELNENTILYSIDGTIGNIARYRGEKCILGKGACYLNVKNSVCADYIYYLLQSSYFTGYIASMSTGSTIHHISLETMRKFSFDLPPYETQKAIGGILATLDQKIHNNSLVCAELESMAKTLYDYWFVQFDFPDANGKPYKPDGLVYARYDLPADCSIDVSYIGFFHSVEAAELYDAGVVKDDSAFDGELSDQEPDLGLSYIMNGDNTYSVNHLGSCTASVVVIPSTYNGLPVTRIMPRVFWEYSQVTCFVFPDSIEVIEQDAAPYCANLKTIYFGKGLKSIGNWAFFQCTSLTDIYYAGSEEEWDRINNGQEWVPIGVTVHFNAVYVP
jgi:restriction endonuclease S subunit